MKNRLLRAALFASVIGTALPMSGQALAQADAKAPNDEAIVAAVKAALAGKPELKASDLKVTSKNGEVTLEGPVEDGRTLYNISVAAQKVSGVKFVINEMMPKH